MNEFDRLSGAYAAAVFAKDIDALVALYDEDVVVFDTWSQWLYDGRDAWAEVIRGWLSSLGPERVRVTFDPHRARVGDELGFWCATVRYASLDLEGNEIRAMENRISWTAAHGANGWRIVHEHTSAPAAFDTMKVRLDSKPGA